MRASQLFTKSSRMVPGDEPAKNAQLLIRAGFVHKEMAGVYAYLPFGLRVLENISQIIREEMNAIGGNEVRMSTLLSKGPWEATDRWADKNVDNWFKSKLANGTEVGIGLTHEEPIIVALKRFASSYQDFPVYIYQIQNKFRNELRAKSGLMRGREFLMKDLYSFCRNQQEHDKFYETVTEAYGRIFDRLGLGDITVKTFAGGGIFSKYSHEFQTISDIGEDTIYVDKEKKLAINKEVMTPEILEELGLKQENLEEKRAVEVANIFSLGSKYTDALALKFVDENDSRQSIVMGCYGMGVSRLMGLLAEHFADEKGLIWPDSVAPFMVYLVQIGDSEGVKSACHELYESFNKKNVSVFWDDRDERPGVKFSDADLCGVPYRVVISEQTLLKGQLEVKKRSDQEVQMMSEEPLLKVLGNK